MRFLLLALPLLLVQAPPATAQVNVGIGIQFPGVSIGINLPFMPELVRVPGYPVYYAPQAPTNYFFYDGLYWVFQGDEWYASGWYNGPWRRVAPEVVPVYVLRVPVQYYHQPPPYFRGWRADAPPRWGERWGHDWEQRRHGWDRPERHAAPPPAPLPDYQRKYPQSRYPQEPTQQQAIRSEHYRYEPRDQAVRQQTGKRPEPERVQARPPQAPAPQQRSQAAPQDRGHDPGRSESSNRGQEKKGNAGSQGHDDGKKGNQGGKGGG